MQLQGFMAIKSRAGMATIESLAAASPRAYGAAL